MSKESLIEKVELNRSVRLLTDTYLAEHSSRTAQGELIPYVQSIGDQYQQEIFRSTAYSVARYGATAIPTTRTIALAERILPSDAVAKAINKGMETKRIIIRETVSA